MKSPKICALIPVRMKSTRLPKKALVDINGYTAIERVVNNLAPSQFLDEVILTTSTHKDDDLIEKLAKEKGIPYFRGDEDNVVKRFIDAADKHNIDIIVRVTGDCPLVSNEVIDHQIKSHLENKADYTGIEINKLPIGSYGEVINYSALKKLTEIDVDLSYTEYMTFYFVNNPELFRINIISCENQDYIRPNYRMTLDYQEDLDFFRVLFRELGSEAKAVPLIESIEYLDEHPEIAEINKGKPLKWREDSDLINKLNKITKVKKN